MIEKLMVGVPGRRSARRDHGTEGQSAQALTASSEPGRVGRRPATIGTQGEERNMSLQAVQRWLPRQASWKRGGAVLATLALAAGATACGSSPSSHSNNPASPSPGATSSAGGSKSILTVSGNSPGPVPKTFNPFVPTSGGVSLDADMMIYEPLLQYNILKGGQVYPWLASSYKLSSDGKTLTFNLRKGVTWSDGKPFTSADVVYTFGALKKYPSLNSSGVKFNSVVAHGKYQVVVNLPKPYYPAIYNLGSVLIVPAHLWKNQNPQKWGDPSPVGTGPYTVKSFDTQNLTLVRNPHYWMKGKPKVYELQYPEYDSASAGNLALEEGKIPWAGNYLPAVKKTYIAKDPQHRHYWFAPAGLVSLLPNNTVYPLNSVKVRQAISDAVNRQTISKVGESGYEAPVTSPTGLVLPNDKSDMAPQYKNLHTKFDPAAAKKLLKSAGLKMGSGGYFLGKDGKPITLTIEDPSTYTDYMTNDAIVKNDLKAIGIDVNVKGVSVNSWLSDLASGRFDLTVYWSNTGPSPYYVYQGYFDKTLTAPIGKTASGNYERWSSAATQTYLNDYTQGTTASQRMKGIHGLEGIMANDVPVVPLVYSAIWYEWDDTNFTGWPTPKNPYSPGEPAGNPAEIVAVHLKPKG